MSYGSPSWYLKRLQRMSPPEVAHRLRELATQKVLKLQTGRWERFSGDWPVKPMPGLAAKDAAPALLAAAGEAAQRTIAGEFDYLGQAWPAPGSRPWWTSDVWTLDPATGRHWPGAETYAFDTGFRRAEGFGDIKWVWEPNRLQMIQPLALHAATSGDAEARDTVWAIVQGWMARNPPFQGINWTSGIEVASRIASVGIALAFAPPTDAGMAARLSRFMAAHARWLSYFPSLFSSANNHRVAELAGLFLAGLCQPDRPGAARELDHASAELETEVLRQFHPDGVGAEQALNYAAFSLEWFSVCAAAGEAAGRPLSPAYLERLAAAAEHLCWMMDAAGETPKIGDEDHGRVLCLQQQPEAGYVASVVALAQRVTGRPQVPARLRTPHLRDLIGGATPEDASVREGVRTFGEGGYTVFRRDTPQGRALVVFDHGPLGYLSIAAHGHADALSVWLHLEDEPVLVDPGTYLYHAGGAIRDRLRGTPAHNTLAIDGRDQSLIGGPFNWTAHATAALSGASGDATIRAEHDGYRRRYGLTHQRTISFDGVKLAITDRLLGSPSRPDLAWSCGFTLDPGVRLDLAQDGSARLVTPKGRSLRLRATGLDAAPLAWRVVDHPVSPSFNVLLPSRRIEISGAVTSRDSDNRVAVTDIALDFA